MMMIRAGQMDSLRKDHFLRRFRQRIASELTGGDPDGPSPRESGLERLYDRGTEMGIETDRPMEGFLSMCITSDSPERVISAVRAYLKRAGGDADSAIEGLLEALEERGRDRGGPATEPGR